MTFSLQNLDKNTIEALARDYEEQGFCQLTGLEKVITSRFRQTLANLIGLDEAGMDELLETNKPAVVFPPELRQKLARVDTSRELARHLLNVLEPVFTRVMGPFVHVSSTFHAQFKGGTSGQVDHGGYLAETKYMEVHGPYLLHQDFAGASIPTSPSAATLWVGLNSCPDWNLRLFPRSHRLGLLCNKWLQLDDPRLSNLDAPINVAARPGSAVLFNSLLLHGTSNAGPLRRVSCDIRFFPMCGFLPSETHFLGSSPCATLRKGLKSTPGEVLQAPLLEDELFLGGKVNLSDVPPFSVLNWVNYLAHVIRGEMDLALPHLERFVNSEIGIDSPAAYISKFHGRPIHEATLRSVHQRLSLAEPGAPEVARLATLINEVSKRTALPS